MAKAHPDDGKYDILIVPGNHDYGTGAHADPAFVAKFKRSYYKHIGEENENFTYPLVKIVGNGIQHEKIAFIGLDSNEDELHRLDSYLADGEIGKEQLEHLAAALKDDDVRKCAYRVVYLHHHPFESPIFHFGHWLKDRRKLKKVLKKAAKERINVDAMLFGHNHKGRILATLISIKNNRISIFQSAH